MWNPLRIVCVAAREIAPAHLGTRYFEPGKFQGFKNEKPLLVIEYEQERLLTLATFVEVGPSYRESSRIEPLSEGTCRGQFTTEIGGVPIAPEFSSANP